MSAAKHGICIGRGGEGGEVGKAIGVDEPNHSLLLNERIAKRSYLRTERRYRHVVFCIMILGNRATVWGGWGCRESHWGR